MNLGFQLQNLFKRGSAPWAVKYFKEKLLTALTDDLLTREQNGFNSTTCNDVKNALADSISKVEYLKDGGYFYKHLHENLSEFLEIYTKWNDVRRPEDRYYLLLKLRQRKSSIFLDFYSRMDSLQKLDKQKARYQEYLVLLNSEQKRNAEINTAFQDLVEKHPKIFIKVKKALDVFNTRIDGI